MGDSKNKNKYDFILYDSNGKVLTSYKNVNVVHWDKNIYKIYTEKDDNLLEIIHKGDNMYISIKINKE